MATSLIVTFGVCPGQMPWRLLLAGRTHNPPVVGSSPTRPTVIKGQLTSAFSTLGDPIGGLAAAAWLQF